MALCRGSPVHLFGRTLLSSSCRRLSSVAFVTRTRRSPRPPGRVGWCWCLLVIGWSLSTISTLCRLQGDEGSDVDDCDPRPLRKTRQSPLRRFSAACGGPFAVGQLAGGVGQPHDFTGSHRRFSRWRSEDVSSSQVKAPESVSPIISCARHRYPSVERGASASDSGRGWVPCDLGSRGASRVCPGQLV